MSYWPALVDACKGCGGSSDRLSHGGRGLCHRCYYLTRRREAAEQWAYGQPTTFGRFAPAPYREYLLGLAEDQFGEFKKAYISWIKRALAILRTREERRCGGVDALSLEYKFADVLKLLNPRAISPRNASFLARHFDKQQMAIIYALLDDMIDASTRNSDSGAFRAGFDAVSKLIMSQRPKDPDAD